MGKMIRNGESSNIPGYSHSRLYPGIYVSPTGSIIDASTHAPIKVFQHNGVQAVKLKPLGEDVCIAVTVARVVASTYVTQSPTGGNRLIFIDGDRSNVDASNIKWAETNAHIRGCTIYNYDLTDYVETAQDKVPVESAIPGLYRSDLYPWVAVSTDGQRVVDLHSGKVKAQYEINGYATVNTYSAQLDRKTTVGVHRIVADAFKKRPTVGDLHVNHKNGIRNDNRKDNVEWVTHKANIQHAVATGLADTWCRAVKAYNVKTGWVSVFPNALCCSRKTGVDKSTLWGMLERRETFPFNKEYVFFYCDEPWPDLKSVLNPASRPKNRPNAVVAWDVEADKKYIARDVTELSRVLGVPRSTIQVYLRRRNSHMAGGYVYRWLDGEELTWPDRDALIKERSARDTRCILVCAATGAVSEYPDMKAAGAAMGISKNGAAYRFKSKEGELCRGYYPYFKRTYDKVKCSAA